MAKVIGLTGPMCSGKGTVVKLLKKKGYICFVYSDIIRDELKSRGMKETRENLQDVGNELRKTYGNHILSERLVNKIIDQEVKLAVVDGIRNPGEIHYLQQNLDDFTLIGITASADTRFRLSQLRGGLSDPKTRKEFDILEKRDRGVGEDKHGQQVQACLDMADVVIENNDTLQNLKEKLISVKGI